MVRRGAWRRCWGGPLPLLLPQAIQRGRPGGLAARCAPLGRAALWQPACETSDIPALSLDRCLPATAPLTGPMFRSLRGFNSAEITDIVYLMLLPLSTAPMIMQTFPRGRCVLCISGTAGRAIMGPGAHAICCEGSQP